MIKLLFKSIFLLSFLCGIISSSGCETDSSNSSGCTSNQECADMHELGWYCKTTLGKCFEGTALSGDCANVPTISASAPCEDTASCVTSYGAGWYCDTNHAYVYGECQTNWPICKEE